jgi:Flp pilus assembly pilin Flp
VALIAVVIAGIVTALGLALNAKLQKACESVNTGTSVSCSTGSGN